jgi:hypothetical protein
MPYIKPEDRRMFNKAVAELLEELLLGSEERLPGKLNYCISSLVWGIWNERPCYETANAIMGALECIKQEFYRRQVVPYEDAKCQENGDLQ